MTPSTHRTKYKHLFGGKVIEPQGCFPAAYTPTFTPDVYQDAVRLRLNAYLNDFVKNAVWKPYRIVNNRQGVFDGSPPDRALWTNRFISLERIHRELASCGANFTSLCDFATVIKSHLRFFVSRPGEPLIPAIETVEIRYALRDGIVESFRAMRVANSLVEEVAGQEAQVNVIDFAKTQLLMAQYDDPVNINQKLVDSQSKKYEALRPLFRAISG